MNHKVSDKSLRKQWLHLLFRIIYVYCTQNEKTSDIVTKGYNKLAQNYDIAWTNHMRDLSDDMIQKLPIAKNATCLDLFCGTGYVTEKLAKRSNGTIIGVDTSKGMLKVAKENYGNNCQFVQEDALTFLKMQPDNSFDIITCAWALCYSKPYQVIKEIARVLKPGGYAAIIDNKLFAIWELFIAMIHTVAEQPKMLKHVMSMNLLPNRFSLNVRLKLNRLHIVQSWDGEKTYFASSGKEVINRILTTGEFSGCQYFIYPQYHKQASDRFASIIEQRQMKNQKIPITHRYIASIAKK